MKRLFTTLLAAAIVTMSAARARAAFEDLGVGARAPGMGGAFTAVADDVYAIYYNPAGLGLLSRPQFGASYSALYPGLSDRSSLSTSFAGYAHPLAEGDRGTVAGAWNSFALNTSLYREDALYLSYGRLAGRFEGQGDLYLGGSFKYLRSSFGSSSEESNATNGILRTGTADPLLSGPKSHGAPDFDLGGLFRIGKHYQIGLQILHLTRPNMAFSSSDSDRLPMAVKLGFNYRSLISNLVAQYDTRTAPNGRRDQNFTVGAERWFPSRFVGDLGLRGAIAVGSRQYKEITMGMTYRTQRVSFDYGFALPIQTVSGTAGNHRLGLTFRFGRPSDEEESLELVLVMMRELRGREAGDALKAGDALAGGQKRTVEEYLAQSRAHLSRAQYQAALEKFSEALKLMPADQAMLTRFSRLNLVVRHFNALGKYRSEPVSAALHRSVSAFVVGKDFEAMEKASLALTLSANDARIDAYVAQLELATGLKRFKGLHPTPKSHILETKLTEAESALEDKNYPEAIRLSLEVIREDDTISLAWQNLGTAYFALRDFTSSLRAWQTALKYEKSPAIREAIRGYLKSITRLRRGKGPSVKPAPAAAALPQSPKMSATEVQRLINLGVDHYTRREFEKARDAFKAIVDANPNNAEASRALKRVEEELK